MRNRRIWLSLFVLIHAAMAAGAYGTAPQVTSTSPTSGPTGTQVQINGSGFGATQGSSTVKFDGSYAATVNSWSDTRIVATVPTQAFTGFVLVTVAGVDSNRTVYFNVPPPQNTSISPTTGGVGTQVTITGSGFQIPKAATSSIKFNGIPGTVITWNDAQIVATVAANTTTGAVQVAVNGVLSNQDQVFTMPNPIVSGLTPTNGPVGTSVQINGSGFAASQGSSIVQFNGVNAAATAWSDSSITVTVPTAATSGTVLITVGGVTTTSSVKFTIPPPQINSISPATGPAGTVVTVNGSGFQSVKGSNVIQFNGSTATTSTWTDTQIVATVPSGTPSGPVRVFVNSLSSNADFEFVLPNPVVTSISPSSGPVGTQVTVLGTGFGATQGTSTLKFLGIAASIVSWSDTQIVATVPPSATSGYISVTVSNVVSPGNLNFTVPAAHISSVSPSSGLGSTQVTITGTGFRQTKTAGGNTSSLYFNGAQASVVTWSDTQIVATVPSGATSGPVYITGMAGNSNADLLFTMPNPIINGLSPSVASGGTQIQINGSGFGASQAGNSVIFYFNHPASIVSWSDTQIVATVPAVANTGAVTVVVGGVTSNGNINLTVPPPTVVSVSPANGVIGSQVTISGSGFQPIQGTNSVWMNNAQMAVNSWSDTQIIATVPASAVTNFVRVAVNGVESNRDVLFTLPSPSITGFAPAGGAVGSQIQISGTGFGATQGTSTASIGATNISIATWSDSLITGTVATGSTTGAVKVSVGGITGSSSSFSVANVFVNTFSPQAGPVNTSVTVNGNGFGASQGSSTISFNNILAAVSSWSDTQIVASVPASTTTGPIKVTVGSASSTSGSSFTVGGVVVTSLSPNSGLSGTQVQINGSGFGATQGSSSVTFNGSGAAIVGWTNTQITATVPNQATTGPVKVTVGGVASNATVIFSKPRKTITSISPSTAPVSTPVTNNGRSFGATQGNSNVVFTGGNLIVTGWSDTTITGTVPASGRTGTIQVLNGAVGSNNNVYFTVPGVRITSASPASGVVGAQVTINGSTFSSTRGSVTFNGQNASIVSWSDTQIVATVPANARTGPVVATANGLDTNKDVIFSMPNPVVTSLSPTSGPAGTQVQVSGFGFGASQGSSTLTFNGAVGTITNWSDTLITATVPTTASSGVVGVAVGGVPSSLPIYFTVPAPQIVSISPNQGTFGTQVTVTGTGFHTTSGNNNFFLPGSNGFPAALPIVSWSDTQIVATVPGNAVTGGIWASVNGVTSNSDVEFALFNPRVTGLSPSAGPVGTQVQINGSGFGSAQGTSSLFFAAAIGFVNATVVSWSDAQIVATVPSSAAGGAVKVQLPGGITSNSNIVFTVPTPRITSISPATGSVGSVITITGSGFQAAEGNSYVSFNTGLTTSAISWSDTQILVAVPTGSTTGAVKVVANSGVSSNQDFVFNMPNPTVAALSPASGPAGSQVQVNGTGFGATQGGSTISFNNFAASVVSWSDAQIVATVPLRAVSGTVLLSVGGVNSNSNLYFNVPAPTITSISPTIGGVGNPITIIGTGFQALQGSNNSVSFSGSGSAIVNSWSDTQITAIVPNTTTGFLDVSVNGVPSNYLNYTIPSQTISSLSPSAGPVGTQVTLTGSAFGSTQGTSVLSFNGQSATVSSWSNTQIIGTVPVTAAAGPAVVNVGGVNSNTAQFTVPPPSVSLMSPAGGIAGTQITIAGSAFQPTQRNSTLTFNGTPATITSWSDTQIVANVPGGATTGPLLVTVNSVSSPALTFEVPTPVISLITPPEAPAGGVITITGSGFGPGDKSRGLLTVGFINFNGVQVGAISWSDTSITTQVPSNATTGSVTISKFDATSPGVPFTVEGAPSVASLSPDNGPVDSTVTINGSGFGSAQRTSSVLFNGAQAFVNSWSDTSITAVVPGGATTGPVSVNVLGIGGPASKFKLTSSVQVTDSLGTITSYHFEQLGGQWNYSRQSGTGCSSCEVQGVLNLTKGSAAHNDSADVTSTTDELTHTTSYTWDSDHNLLSQSTPLDANNTVTSSYTYNSFGEPLTVTDALGNVTTNAFDGNGNLVSVTSPAPAAGIAASVTQFAYDAKGQLTTITDPLSHITTLAYYPTGLIHTITDTQSNVTTYEYDLRGNRTAVVDAQQNRTTFAYDLGNRPTGITYPDTTSVSFAYDGRGRRTSVTDQNGKVTSYAFDDADRLTSVTDAAQNVTHYAYDTENNLLSITDAAGHTTSFLYDSERRVVQTGFPSGLVESYVYDVLGNLTSKTDRKNQTIQYVYDALNRLSHKGYPDATGVDYVYDLAGKIKQVSDPTGSYGMAYDNMGRLLGTTTQYSFLPGITYSNAYGFDAASNRTSFTAPDGSTNTYAYDTLGRLNTLTNSLTGQFGFSYDALSRRTALNRPNGVNTSYGYDSLSRLLNVQHKAGTVTLDGAGYTYDSAGSRTAKTNYLNNITEQYTYDPTYQLTQVTQGTTTTESYNYDAVGNRLSSLGMSPYAYNSSNELTSTPAATFTYDANGNSLTKADSTGTRSYTWDFENRLTSVVLPGTGGTVTFKYDPFGRRIQKSSLNGTTNYLYDGANSIAETDAAGALLASYAQSAGLDEPLAEIRSGVSGYFEQDGLGSVTSIAGINGTPLNSDTYDSFGNLAVSSGSFANPFQYTGRDFDSETGLRYYRARYYSSDTGRFLSEDPIQFMSGRGSFYAYVWNSPLVWTDPSGMRPGDKYPNCQNAAFDALKDIFRTSMSEGLEYAGRLYLNWDGTCSYTAPHKGTKAHSNAGPCPWFHKPVGSYHTHPRIPGYDYENFSYDTDIKLDNYNNEVGFLATPSGKVWRHDPFQDPIQVGTIGTPGQSNKPSPGHR